MPPKLVQTVFVDVLEHARGAAGDLAAFAHTFEFAAAVGVGLAFHVVVVERTATGTDEVGGAEERCGGGADLVDGGNGGGQRGGVVKEGLVEAVVGCQYITDVSGEKECGDLPRLASGHVGRFTGVQLG